MRFPSPVSIQWIADLISAELHGDVKAEATGINEIHRVEPGDLVFVDHPKYYQKCLDSAATFIIINKQVDFPNGKAILVVKDPFESYLKIVRHFRPFMPSTKMISDSAIIGEGSFISPGAFIGTSCVHREKLHFSS